MYLTSLLGLFFLTITDAAQGPSVTDEFKKHATKQACIVAGTQVIEGLNKLKEDYGMIPTSQKKQLELLDLQIQAAKIELEVKNQQIESQNDQKKITDRQALEHDHDILLKQVSEFQHMKNLDPNDPEIAKYQARLKLKYKKLNEDLPESEEKETKKADPEKKDKEEPKGDGFWKTLATHFMLAAATAGTMTDSIADYSVEYITGHDLFKDTFVNKYKKVINRTVVAVTLYAILHKSYSLYKKYQAERNATEDDIFADDED